MGLGDLTRQFAQEAIKSSTKDMLDSLRPPELSSIADAIAGAKPNAPPAVTDNTGAVLPGVTVTVRHEGTNVERTLVTAKPARL